MIMLHPRDNTLPSAYSSVWMFPICVIFTLIFTIKVWFPLWQRKLQALYLWDFENSPSHTTLNKHIYIYRCVGFHSTVEDTRPERVKWYLMPEHRNRIPGEKAKMCTMCTMTLWTFKCTYKQMYWYRTCLSIYSNVIIHIGYLIVFFGYVIYFYSLTLSYSRVYWVFLNQRWDILKEFC